MALVSQCYELLLNNMVPKYPVPHSGQGLLYMNGDRNASRIGSVGGDMTFRNYIGRTGGLVMQTRSDLGFLYSFIVGAEIISQLSINRLLLHNKTTFSDSSRWRCRTPRDDERCRLSKRAALWARPATNIHALLRALLRVLRLLIIAGEKGQIIIILVEATSLEHVRIAAVIEISREDIRRKSYVCIKLSTDCGRRKISKD
ncbi:hypothetical protein PAAG_11974 [Paracoccidioides lutzii Pb01]|uniref:Uncharacterized protein n=1 Tax=Paracoccidioides lutzii (strain ATCC MYA-826 / Pb01) TaxID=502779 RepID=A0A0A2V1D0_PARBA|nr:hypothetical protein PAAG_11974 [Paracoccidioides lutzii Pb01]KGQ01298.1 hypothetical protein PAAG_11974 [Paracoccidioides lutzii Pb01]